MMVVFKGRYRGLVRDECVGSACVVERVGMEEEKPIDKDLQVLCPEQSLPACATTKATFYEIDDNMVIEPFESLCDPLGLGSSNDKDEGREISYKSLLD